MIGCVQYGASTYEDPKLFLYPVRPLSENDILPAMEPDERVT
jgi:hypothetical protein